MAVLVTLQGCGVTQPILHHITVVLLPHVAAEDGSETRSQLVSGTSHVLLAYNIVQARGFNLLLGRHQPPKWMKPPNRPEPLAVNF